MYSIRHWPQSIMWVKLSLLAERLPLPGLGRRTRLAKLLHGVVYLADVGVWLKLNESLVWYLDGGQWHQLMISNHLWVAWLCSAGQASVSYIVLMLGVGCAYGHTTWKTLVLVWSPKLSNVGLGQYSDGWPPGNTGCRQRFPFHIWRLAVGPFVVFSCKLAFGFIFAQGHRKQRTKQFYHSAHRQLW